MGEVFAIVMSETSFGIGNQCGAKHVSELNLQVKITAKIDEFYA